MIEEMPANYARRVGERLRDVRKQQHLSLQAVEASSREEFKASVLGAYERGERAISVPRLQRLARFYNVPVDQLLPKEGNPEAWAPRATNGSAVEDLGKVTIDLTRVDGEVSDEMGMLSRYLRMIQVQRQDFNGRVLTIRDEDMRVIACMFDSTPEDVRARLGELGLRR